jgi:TRAP-type mannitol/chloroaromatic compound transport system permease small subunit
MLKKTVTAIDRISVFIGKLFSFIILPVTLLEAVEVVLRYGFDSPTDWSWELAAMLSGAMFVTGAAWVLKDNKHVRTDLVYAKLPHKWQAIFDLFYSVGILESTFSMWSPPLYPLKIIIALSFIILLLQGLAKWIRDLYFLIKGCEI